MAARSPALKPVAAVPPDATPATVESLGQQLREVLPTRRLHSVSLCDHQANVLWLSEGALGPDEHSVVLEALEVLAADTTLQCHEMALEDGRLALSLPVRTPHGDLVGIALILADGKSLGDDTLERMAAAPVRAIMQRLAVLLKPSAASPASGKAPVPQEAPASVTPPARPAAARAPLPAARPTTEPLSPERVNDILEFELSPEDTGHVPVLRALAETELTSATSSEMVRLEFLTDDEPTPPSGAPIPAAAPIVPAAAAPAAAPITAAAAAPAAAPVAAAAATPAAASSSVDARDAATERARPPAALATDRSSRAPPVQVPANVPVAAPADEVSRPKASPAAATPSAGATTAAAASPVSDQNLLLELVPFAKLRAGGQTRRFQILARISPTPRDPAAQDALVLQRLMTWLAANRAAWNSQPTSFTVGLSIATLEDERFAQKVAAALNSHGIAAETLGFEIPQALCTQRRAPVERFIAQCEKLGAWVVLDDFSFDSQTLPLLRSKALRLVKIDPKLTSAALKDKLSQAMVIATVQAAKVLGIHCAAQKVDSQAALQWLTAIGCDFGQGTALGRPQSLDSLGSLPEITGLTAHLRST